jgi:hypothetical protein
MHIYKFRILLEDNEQFFREIDIKANQTFEDFHQVLVTTAGFDNSEMSSFYICDSKWSKQQEICLCDMSLPEEAEEEDADEDDRGKKQKKAPILTMCNTTLKDAINDPHQRLMYVYDFLKMHTFYIELYKIKEAEKGVTYPLVVKSIGAVSQPPLPIDPDDEDLAEDLGALGEEEDGIGGEDMMEGLYDDTIIN